LEERKLKFRFAGSSALVLALSVTLTGCFDDDSENPVDPSRVPNAVVLQGNITSDMTLTAGTAYLLRGAVFVADGATLTVQAGTTIYGEGATNGTLIVSQGGMIDAQGTPSSPIVFTSDQPVGSRGRGQWGGLIINGRAPINTGQVAFGEGDTGQYGGSVADDNSGTLRYVRVEYAGIEFSPDNELNGIAFQGVGSGTTVDHVQVHMNQDDGIEFFGGTVGVKYALCTGIRDDCFDWTDGWTGKGQFWIAQQWGDDADNGFEADNEGDNNDATPRSNPTIYNVTLVGDPGGPESDTGMLLREGTAGRIGNAVVTGFTSYGLDVDQTVTHGLAGSGALSVTHSLFWNNGPADFDTVRAGDDDFDETAWALEPAKSNWQLDPGLIDAFDKSDPDFRPGAGSNADTLSPAVPPSDGFFDATVDFIGGMDPSDDWTAGWTSFSAN
jgi:hypothetical protein